MCVVHTTQQSLLRTSRPQYFEQVKVLHRRLGPGHKAVLTGDVIAVVVIDGHQVGDVSLVAVIQGTTWN